MTMLYNDAGRRWEIVHKDGDDPLVQRYPVPGGWLYQVIEGTNRIGTHIVHPPIFVPLIPHPDPGAKSE